MVENLLWLARLLFLGLVYWFFFKLIRAVTVDFRGTFAENGVEREETEVKRARPLRGAQPLAHAQPVSVLYLREKPGQTVIYARGLEDGKEQIIEAGQPVPLEESTSVGRNPDNQLVIAESFVSGRHARFYRQNDGYWVEDLGSTNGTFLNGKRLKKPRPLRNGDKIRLGDTVFEFAR